jgi:hypothetical protein
VRREQSDNRGVKRVVHTGFLRDISRRLLL